jgi:two-component system, NtrC family, response regulator HydG
MKIREEVINRYWKKIFNTINDGLLLIGTDGTILMVNRTFERLMGYTSDEIIGKPCTVLNCDACERTLVRRNGPWCALFEQDEDIRKRCLIMRKDGTYLQTIKNASPLKDDRGMMLGAVETITDISELDRLDREIDQLSRHLDVEGGFHGIVGRSKAMHKIFEVIEKAANSDAPVIIYGESGTGKELVALAIHLLGRRRDGPFVQINCAALNPTLLESELFGHVKGAFTGAYRHRIGRFEAAHMGDIFLDEVGDVPLTTQVKLLRVLETKKFERVGDHKPIAVDARIITATNKDLRKLIGAKEFREDFFFRINVLPIYLPPLRERKEDIPLLIQTFLNRLRCSTGKDVKGLTPSAMASLTAHDWPGNVRELKSALEYAFVVGGEGWIDVHHLPPLLSSGLESGPTEDDRKGAAAAEKEALMEALRETGGNQVKAARLLGVSRVTIWNRMRRHGIDLKKVFVS